MPRRKSNSKAGQEQPEEGASAALEVELVETEPVALDTDLLIADVRKVRPHLAGDPGALAQIFAAAVSRGLYDQR